MENFRIVPYSQEFKSLWNSFVLEANNATFLFNRNFMDYHADRFHDFSLLIFLKDELIAIFPANRVEDNVFSHQGLTYGGLVIGSKTYSHTHCQIFASVLKFYKGHNINQVVVKQIPAIYSKQPMDDLEYLAYICEANILRRDLHTVIDFSAEYRMSKSVLRDVKQNIKKHQIYIQESTNLKEFWDQLLIPNLHESYQAKPVHTLQEIELLKQNFPDQIKLFTCTNNTELVGGVLIFESQKVAHCQYISGTKQLNKLGLMTNLMLEIIDHYKTEKKYFNFGTSHISQGKQINAGLQTWKEKFGGRSLAQDTYAFNTHNHYLISSIFV